ncbi:unnamed protein product [Phytophthora lilii]|uniref:Unnamed protein product n=1 Tax=Phytophthora lilii TaxID=2077276 RepID=A0A9W6XGE0_9STRA|nr:unnamed protein product [Phytophthora lilii]
MTPDNSVILGVMDILPTEVAGISLQPTTTKDELPPKVHTHVPIIEDQGVTQRAETSAEMTAIQHEVIVKDVRGNTGLVPPAADSLIPPTTAVSGENCANKCMTPADARSSKKLQTWFAANPPTETGLVPIELPQLAEPAVEEECIYAFVGKCEWPEEDGNEIVKTTELLQERSGNFGAGDMKKYSDEGSSGDDTDNWDPGERRINDSRTRILLDTGANVSVISECYAKILRLHDIPNHGRCMELQGIMKGKTATSRRASVKITLGWERVYVFDVRIMDHNAGVDVVLGTDFMIPAGVRLDLFNATAKLPDEVKVPLIKTQT